MPLGPGGRHRRARLPAPPTSDDPPVTRPLLFASGGSEAEWTLAESGAPAELDRLAADPGDHAGTRTGAGPAPWELEIGFGKGRYLLRRAAESPARRFLGIEMAGQYFRITVERARKRGLDNVLALQGEALYALCSALPRGFAEVVHVYHPDPWPKARHHKRRLFDPETLDLVLGALVPGGTLYFATDHMEYGEVVVEILERHPALSIRRLQGPWADGPRTNYEAKYMEEGRPILRLVVTLEPGAVRAGGPAGEGDADRERLLHPDGRRALLCGPRPGSEGDEGEPA